MNAPTVKRPILKYFGSKWRMASRIIELLGPHTSYVEPFAGSASVLLQKPECPIEVLNDLNRDIVTFFRVLRDRPKELLEKIELTPFAREEYAASTKVPYQLDDEVERARLFFVRSWQGFSGSATQARNGWRYQQRIYNNRISKTHLDWHGLDRLEAAAVRIRRCQIEHDDALKVMLRFDGPGTAFYIDPPYPSSTRSKQWGKSAYQHELNIQQHVHLLNLVKRLQGQVVLSCYECELYSEMLPDWRKIEVKIPNNRHTGSVEILWVKP